MAGFQSDSAAIGGGRANDLPVSVPIANRTRSPTTAEPDDEAPVMRAGFHGLRARVKTGCPQRIGPVGLFQCIGGDTGKGLNPRVASRNPGQHRRCKHATGQRGRSFQRRKTGIKPRHFGPQVLCPARAAAKARASSTSPSAASRTRKSSSVIVPHHGGGSSRGSPTRSPARHWWFQAHPPRSSPSAS